MNCMVKDMHIIILLQRSRVTRDLLAALNTLRMHAMNESFLV